jgi:hypothetical protein
LDKSKQRKLKAILKESCVDGALNERLDANVSRSLASFTRLRRDVFELIGLNNGRQEVLSAVSRHTRSTMTVKQSKE